MKLPAIAKIVADQLAADRTDRPYAAGARYRMSSARACARQIAFAALKVEPDHDLPTDTLAAFSVGDDWHRLIQKALISWSLRTDGATVFTEVECEIPEANLGGHADALVRFTDGSSVLVEIKSMARFAFDLATEGRVGNVTEEPGPKIEHVTQAALYATALGADAVWIVYCCKDNGAMAEWLIPMGVGMYQGAGPTPRELANEELDRLRWIDGHVRAEQLPPRMIPGAGPEVAAPPKWGSKGNGPLWRCAYCRWQPTCVRAGAGAQPVPVYLTPANASEAPF